MSEMTHTQKKRAFALFFYRNPDEKDFFYTWSSILRYPSRYLQLGFVLYTILLWYVHLEILMFVNDDFDVCFVWYRLPVRVLNNRLSYTYLPSCVVMGKITSKPCAKSSEKSSRHRTNTGQGDIKYIFIPVVLRQGYRTSSTRRPTILNGCLPRQRCMITT